jgi:4-amino-4-deoxy-L-arabinose transferase-like glycosyltransferase
LTAAATNDAAWPARLGGIARAPAFWLGAACFLVHLVANAHYDVFRDELYFIVCGLHPAFGYVDQPPLVPLIAAASYKLFGTALTPLRLVPALAMSATVALTADFARWLGGGRFAQWLAGLSTLLAPALLVGGVLLSTDCLQALTWLACAWILARLAASGDERWWLAFGAVVGLSFESKYLIAPYMAALAIGVVATPLRRSLARPWLYVGAVLALAVALPNVLWQALHGWPFLGVVGADVGGKSVGRSPLGLLLQQALFVGLASAPVWLAGLWRLGARPPRPELRALAIAYVVVTAVVVVAHGKAYYSTPIYPVLFAAGGVAWEAWLKRPIARGIAVAVVVVPGLLAAPTFLPILPPETLVAYMQAGGFSPKATQTESTQLAALPQYFADMFGWREMAAAVSAVYRDLPPEERARAVFFGRNYGEAAALFVYGLALGGPPAISGHNSYYLWGPRGASGDVVITLGRDAAGYSRFYNDARPVGRIDNAYAMPYETGLTIWVLRRPRAPLAEIWSALKHYD